MLPLFFLMKYDETLGSVFGSVPIPPNRDLGDPQFKYFIDNLILRTVY